eukprot:7158428-Prorocentrum_lima.AAC.1
MEKIGQARCGGGTDTGVCGKVREHGGCCDMQLAMQACVVGGRATCNIVLGGVSGGELKGARAVQESWGGQLRRVAGFQSGECPA